VKKILDKKILMLYIRENYIREKLVYGVNRGGVR